MKVDVRKVDGVLLYGGVAAITVPSRVEKCPAALGGGVDGIRVTGDEMIEGRIKRDESAFIGGDSAHNIEGARGLAEYLLEGCWHSGMAAIVATAASRLGWPISLGLVMGNAGSVSLDESAEKAQRSG